MRQTRGQDTRSSLIWAGTEICTERGFQGVRIDEVLKRVGVPKGSFYHYFRDKEEFGEEVIRNYARYFEQKIDRVLSNPEKPPLLRFKQLIEDLTTGIARYGFRRGCLVGNLGQELGGLNDIYRERLEQILLSWQERTAVCFREAIATGDLSPEADADRLAEFFWVGWEGSILRAKLSRSVLPMTHFSAVFFDRVLPIASREEETLHV